MGKNQQAAGNTQSAGGGSLSMAVTHVSYETLGISAEEAKTVGRPGNKLTARMLGEALAAYASVKGVSAKEVPCPPVGYAISTALPLGGGLTVYGLTHARFTTTHVIFAACQYSGGDGARQYETQDDVLSRLIIDSDRSPLPVGNATDSIRGQ